MYDNDEVDGDYDNNKIDVKTNMREIQKRPKLQMWFTNFERYHKEHKLFLRKIFCDRFSCTIAFYIPTITCISRR